MIEDKLVTDDDRLGFPFYYTRIIGAPLYESDMKYIDNVIKADKIYRMIVQAHNSWDNVFTTNDPEFMGKTIDRIKYIPHPESRYKTFIEACNLIQFLGKFLDDPECPKHVKYFIYVFVGNKMGHMRRTKGLYQAFVQRSFFTERWMEICR